MDANHPYSRMTDEQRLKIWDDMAETYDGNTQQGDIPDQVVDRLFGMGCLEANDCVLELGAGPGTYSLRIAPRVRILTCMDSSEKMLDRLMSSAKERGYTNIERFHKDWNEYVPRKGYDVCIATLCPGVGSPESILRMEGAARRHCVSVSWIRNHGDDINAEVWKRLGKDYGYSHRESNEMQDWLRDNGRDPEVVRFGCRISYEKTSEEVVASQRKAFDRYGLADQAEQAARDIVSEIGEDGIVRFDHENEIKMTVWKSR